MSWVLRIAVAKFVPQTLIIKKDKTIMSTLTKDLSEQEMAGYNSRTQAAAPRKATILQRYDSFIESVKFSHFAIMAMAILIGSCLGSVAAMLLFYNGAPLWVFIIALFASLANLVVSISQSPTKWMVNTFILSVLVNLVLIAIFPLA
jgi:hypothetical protein